MQAELCGFSLAVAPNEACYVPLSHRQGGEGAEACSAARSRPTRSRKRAALEALKPLFADPGVLKIGQDLKFAWQSFRACAASRSRPTTTPC